MTKYMVSKMCRDRFIARQTARSSYQNTLYLDCLLQFPEEKRQWLLQFGTVSYNRGILSQNEDDAVVSIYGPSDG